RFGSSSRAGLRPHRAGIARPAAVPLETIEQAGAKAIRDPVRPLAQRLGKLRPEGLGGGLVEQREPAREMRRPDALAKMRGERIANIAAGLEQDRRPEVPDHREMRVQASSAIAAAKTGASSGSRRTLA